jgi:hypothetical protein
MTTTDDMVRKAAEEIQRTLKRFMPITATLESIIHTHLADALESVSTVDEQACETVHPDSTRLDALLEHGAAVRKRGGGGTVVYHSLQDRRDIDDFLENHDGLLVRNQEYAEWWEKVKRAAQEGRDKLDEVLGREEDGDVS